MIIWRRMLLNIALSVWEYSGSVARGEQTEDSDVDVYLETLKPNMFALVHIKEDLQTLFGCNVDIVRLRDHMDSLLRNRIEKEGIYM